MSERSDMMTTEASRRVARGDLEESGVVLDGSSCHWTVPALSSLEMTKQQ